jgi:hypothetical protein
VGIMALFNGAFQGEDNLFAFILSVPHVVQQQEQVNEQAL